VLSVFTKATRYITAAPENCLLCGILLHKRTVIPAVSLSWLSNFSSLFIITVDEIPWASGYHYFIVTWRKKVHDSLWRWLETITVTAFVMLIDRLTCRLVQNWPVFVRGGRGGSTMASIFTRLVPYAYTENTNDNCQTESCAVSVMYSVRDLNVTD
jgi:hypothetical protein